MHVQVMYIYGCLVARHVATFPVPKDLKGHVCPLHLFHVQGALLLSCRLHDLLELLAGPSSAKPRFLLVPDELAVLVALLGVVLHVPVELPAELA